MLNLATIIIDLIKKHVMTYVYVHDDPTYAHVIQSIYTYNLRV